MKSSAKRAVTAAFCALLLTSFASAHSGKTDASGGHWDNSTGEYHYHHGYPAHQHTNGICPYDPEYGEATQEQTDEPEEEAPEEAPSEEANEETELYNDGLGDDGTYETAYNLGYQYGMETLCELCKDTISNAYMLTSELCHTCALSGSTPYADKDSSYNQAYEDGYYQSETDFYTAIDKAIEQYLSPEQAQDAAYNRGREDGKCEGTALSKVKLAEGEEQFDERLKNERIKGALASAAGAVILTAAYTVYRKRK